MTLRNSRAGEIINDRFVPYRLNTKMHNKGYPVIDTDGSGNGTPLCDHLGQPFFVLPGGITATKQEAIDFFDKLDRCMSVSRIFGDGSKTTTIRSVIW